LQKTATKTISAERFTPVTLARKLDARVLLESASFMKGRERYSILLVREAFCVRETSAGVFLVRDGTQTRLPDPEHDILDVLRSFAAEHAGAAFDFPFPAGGIGFLSYEYASRFDTVRLQERPDVLGLPQAAFLFGHLFAVFDHYVDSVTLLGVNYDGYQIDLDAAIDVAMARINDMDFNFMAPSRHRGEAEVVDDGDPPRYMAGVKEIREEIIAGNLLQGVLSRRLAVRTDLPALEAYRNLRHTNPSPYMFYLRYDGFELFGASPEVHVRCRQGRAILRPIAGTRRRGADRAEDAALAAELLSDEKELAEHLMLVDLGRNDLGRVCVPGSVEVTEFNVIEHYSHVMHIVSQVEGNLFPDRDGIDALRATFPAGTVSGAPKIRAMEVIDRLEAAPRSFYAGVVGYVEPDGSLDTCIAIRCGLKKDGVIVLQAGAGVVFDSSPERELEETDEKLRALVRALGVTL
jgi:anthranilate synthase component 1